jgi:hypothetical protein
MIQNPLNAARELEIVVGADHIVRINVDGLCVFRTRLNAACELVIRNELMPRPRIKPHWLFGKDKGRE